MYSLILIVFVSLVQIGPPNSRFLTSNDKNSWKAKDVADSVLSDKSALVLILYHFTIGKWNSQKGVFASM